jgi:hypothetical protein
MDLVLFEDAMRHVCRISRIIESPGGHALLVGVGGMGKQSLSKLATFVAGFTVSMIVISATYGVNDLVSLCHSTSGAFPCSCILCILTFRLRIFLLWQRNDLQVRAASLLPPHSCTAATRVCPAERVPH